MMNIEEINEKLYELDMQYQEKLEKIEQQRYALENDYLKNRMVLLEEKILILEKPKNMNKVVVDDGASKSPFSRIGLFGKKDNRLSLRDDEE